MYFLLIPFCYLFFTLIYFLVSNSKIESFLNFFIKSNILFSVHFILIVEILSYNDSLNFNNLKLIWIVFNMIYLLILSFFLCKKQNDIKLFVLTLFRKIKKINILIFSPILILLLLLVLQNLIYSPNNWDSQTYHLARITNWISRSSIDHFPTNNLRQLYQPPFSEYVILNFNLLSKNDLLSSLVQFIYLIFIIPVVISITMLISNVRINYKYIIILIISIPIVLLESSSTQNDIVVSFFILTTFYFTLNYIKFNNKKDLIFLGFSIGLSILTKGTAYIYLSIIPFILIFLFLTEYYKYKKVNYTYFSIIIIVLLINGFQFFRNFQLSQNILGINSSENSAYKNEIMNVNFFISNLIKNASFHMAVYPLNNYIDLIVIYLHKIINVDVNNEALNYFGIKYTSFSTPNSESTASNFIHFYLFNFSFCILLFKYFKKKLVTCNNLLFYYLLFVIFSIIIFAIYLKWQPWHSRLQLPLFISFVPVIYIALIDNFKNKLLNYIIFFLLTYSFVIVFINASRPFITFKYTYPISIFDDRYKKYFATRPLRYKEYKFVSKIISDKKYKIIGIDFAIDSWEYPLFVPIYNNNMTPIHLNVKNSSKIFKTKIDKQIPECIVSTEINSKVIVYLNNKFINLNNNNKEVWIYKRI
jgi:4-amino-4-deoxy-L-arabinose transferase-like glycosyltransferase